MTEDLCLETDQAPFLWGGKWCGDPPDVTCPTECQKGRQYTKLADHGWCKKPSGGLGHIFDTGKQEGSYTIEECKALCDSSRECMSIVLHVDGTRCVGFDHDCSSLDANENVVPYKALGDSGGPGGCYAMDPKTGQYACMQEPIIEYGMEEGCVGSNQGAWCGAPDWR
jgi:hypothetical protein